MRCVEKVPATHLYSLSGIKLKKGTAMRILNILLLAVFVAVGWNNAASAADIDLRVQKAPMVSCAAPNVTSDGWCVAGFALQGRIVFVKVRLVGDDVQTNIVFNSPVSTTPAVAACTETNTVEGWCTIRYKFESAVVAILAAITVADSSGQRHVRTASRILNAGT